MSCRCGEPATKACHLCRADLCEFHTGAKPVSKELRAGVARVRLEPVCFPNCTSDFGTLQERGTLVGRA
jgi:hypothetical protein